MNRRRNRIALALFAFLTVFAFHAAIAAGAGAGEAVPAKADPTQVDRGRYLVTIMGCNDCHTPWRMGENGPEPDMSRMLSGHPQQLVLPPPPALTPGAWESASWSTITAWAGPWGISYTRNLTPDKETGLGSWSEKEFIATLRTRPGTGHRPRAAAADALAGLRPGERRGPGGDVRLPALDPRDRQPRARQRAARRAARQAVSDLGAPGGPRGQVT